jgi:uncharacterized membrane protein YhaH (DUF805 family)
VIAGAVLLALGQGFDALPHDGWHHAFGWVVACALLFSGACLLSKRLHDVGRAGWWAFIPVFALIGAWPRPQTPWEMACAAVLAAFALWLMLAPGQRERNRFGPGRA